MAICIPRFGLAIYTSPKVLSTSLKYLAFELENDRVFDSFVAQGQAVQIHRFYPARPFEPVNRKKFPHVIAFVREPAERFLSMFRNRVVRKHAPNSPQWSDISAAKLRKNPSLDYFIRHFEKYQQLSPDIRHHSSLQTDFLGTESDYFDRIFSNRSVEPFETLIEEITGQRVQLPWEQRSEPALSEKFSSTHREWIREYYARDYVSFSQHFQTPPLTPHVSQMAVRP